MNVLRHYMLVLLLLLLGSGFCGVWAQTVWYKKSSEVVFDGNTPYMIRSATSEKSNLSTRMPASDDKGDSGWRSTKVRVYQSDFTDLSQVFYFVKDASDHILMFTKDASGNRTYIDASSNNWDMNTVTVSGAVLPEGAYALRGYVKAIEDIANTNHVRFIISKDASGNVNNQGRMIANRGFDDGCFVYCDGKSGDDVLSQWIIIPYQPKQYLESEISAVQTLLNSATTGTEWNQLSSDTYKTDLQSAVDAAIIAKDGTVSDIQTAWSNLLAAKKTFLEEAYNDIPTNQYFWLKNSHGEYLRFTNDNSAAQAGAANNTVFERMLVVKIGSDYYVSALNRYLQMSQNLYAADGSKQLAVAQVQFTTQYAPNLGKMRLVHIDNDHIGLYFYSDGVGLRANTDMYNHVFVHYFDDKTAEPFNLRASRQNGVDHVDQFEPTIAWTLEPADVNPHYTYHLINRSGGEVISYIVDPKTSGTLALNSRLISPYANNYQYFSTQAAAQANLSSTADKVVTYADVDAKDNGRHIYVGYDVNESAGNVHFNNSSIYSFCWGPTTGGNTYLQFTSVTANPRPDAAYSGYDNQLWTLDGGTHHDPYDIELHNVAYPGYHLSCASNSGQPVNASNTGHTGTQNKLYNSDTEVQKFAYLKNNDGQPTLISFSLHASTDKYYGMYWGGTQWFNIYGNNNAIPITYWNDLNFIGSAAPITLTPEQPLIHVTYKVVSMEYGSTGGGRVVYTTSVQDMSGEPLALPTWMRSPLAKNYKFYTEDQFDISGDRYTLKPGAVESTVYPAVDNQTFYVKYEYDEDNQIAFGSGMIHVDLTGQTRYTINTRTEASKNYLCWTSSRATFETTSDSYAVSRDNGADPVAAWNDYYLWTFGHADGGVPDPYVITIRSSMPATRNFFLAPQSNSGASGTSTWTSGGSNSWLIPDDASADCVRSWALINGNLLISAIVPGTTSRVVRFSNTGWTYQDEFGNFNAEADVLLAIPAYGYHVVSKAGNEVLSTHVVPPSDLSDPLSLPADLKSAHIIDDADHYRFFLSQAEAAAFSAAADDGARAAAAATAITTYADLGVRTEIYVGYHYDPAYQPAGVPLLAATASAATRYHVQIGTSPTQYWRASDKDNHHRPNFGAGGNELPAADYQWMFVSDNADPYDIKVVTPYWPDNYLHGALDNRENGSAQGAFSTGAGMYLNSSGTDEVNRFFFTQSDLGVVLGVVTPQNKAGRQAYLYNHNNQYALLQRATRGGDERQKFSINQLTLFHIVNKAGSIAVSAFMPATSPLTVPVGLRTPLMTNSQYRFFTTQAAAAAYNADPTEAVADAQGAVTTPSASAELYVGYNYVNQPDVLDLQGERWYNLRGNNSPASDANKYVYTSYTNLNNIDTWSSATKENSVHYMWSLSGNDPYDVVITNGYADHTLYLQSGDNWYLDIYRNKAQTAAHFMLLEHEDAYYSVSMVRPSRSEATAGNRYIGQKEYLWFWGMRDNQHCSMLNNHQTFNYYSDRNSVNSYYTKIAFDPVVYETTFHIIDNAGREAIKYSGEFPANMPLDFAHIPAAIRSPYLIDETLTFYTTATADGTSSDDGRTTYSLADAVTQTPATAGLDLYVRYTTDHLMDKPFRLTGARSFNVRINGDNYIYYDDEDELIKSEATDANKADPSHLWNLYGGDPYAMLIRNVQATADAGGTGYDQVVTYSTTYSDVNALSLGPVGPGTCFIAMRNNTDAYYEVMAATGDDAATTYFNIGLDGTNGVKLYRNDRYAQGEDELQMQLSTSELRARYYIIDYQDEVVISAEDENVELQVPASIRSPFVQTYHYYKPSDFTVSGDHYTLNDPLAAELQNVASSEKDGDVYQIYVTYDKRDDVDLPSLADIARGTNEDGSSIKRYRLKYLEGQMFKQEDGSDHVMDTETKAVYPYANGEANFYVYGQERLDIQMAGAATTRNRWPWFFESDNHDPYHVYVCSSNTTYNLQHTRYSTSPTPADTIGSSESGLRLYFHTYKPVGHSAIVTGAITKQSHVVEHDPADKPTEYMVLGTSLAHCRLVTVNPVDDGDDGVSDERQTVTSFEQYWKNNPTLLDILCEAKGITDAAGRQAYAEDLNAGGDLDDAEKLAIHNMGWHVYEAWGLINSWSSTSSKTYQFTHHAFQTIEMGSDFELEEMTIDPVLILLDQHGWEIMRKPIPINPEEAQASKDAKYAQIRPYDSPMVKCYKFWHVGSKLPGYHKYKVSEPITVTSTGLQYTSHTLTQLPPYYDSDNLWEVNSNGVARKDRLMDQYVTYEVKEEYASAYVGAATQEGITALPFLVEQSGAYAQATAAGSSAIATTQVPAAAIASNDVSPITDEMLWYVKPNFDIDREMGYLYAGDFGAQTDADTKEKTEQDYVDGLVPEWSNGFDPYNLQIQNVEHKNFFSTNATGAELGATASMESTYSTTPAVTLSDVAADVPGVGHDNVSLHITNTTFMAVSDDNGNMRLMPRFDHSNRVTNFVSLSAPLPSAHVGDTEGAQTTILFRPIKFNYIIVDNTGHESLRYQGTLGETTPHIPTHLASPLAKDFVYYKDLTLDEGVYTEIPSGADISSKLIETTFAAAGLTALENDVYVRYSFNPEGDKYHILSQGDWHTISIDSRPLWVDYPAGWPEAVATLPFASGEHPFDNSAYEFQCKFIYNPDTEVPDPYNATAMNRVHATYRWEDAHYAVLAHGDEVAFALARQGSYDYLFLSTLDSEGNVAASIQVYHEPDFRADGTFKGTVSQITFGDVPQEQVSYYVVTNKGKLVLTAREPGTRPTSDPALPTPILPKWARSPLLNTGDYVYYTTAIYDAETDTYSFRDEDRTTRLQGLPADSVYVRYVYHRETCPWMVWDTYERNSEHPGAQTPLDITGETWYNLVNYQWGDDWYRAVSANDRLSYIDRPYQYSNFVTWPIHDGIFDFQGSKDFMLRLSGSDPYDITITNALKGETRPLSCPTDDDDSNLLYFSDDDSDPIKSFMLLNPTGNQLIFVGSGKPNLALGNPRWSGDSKWLYKHVDDYNADAENPYSFTRWDETAGRYVTVNFSVTGIEFFKAPTFRNYTFHAIRFDDSDHPLGETWQGVLRRNWLTTAKMEDDVARLFALYEQYGTTDAEKNVFDTRQNLSDQTRFYADEALTQRLHDPGSDLWDVYPEVDVDDTYHIYFKYKVNTTEMEAATGLNVNPFSTASQVAADVAAYQAETATSPANSFYGVTPQANWFFMVLDTDEDITATTDAAGNRIFTGGQYFLRRENDGTVGWLDGAYALHNDPSDNYKTWNYNRLAEWNKEGDNAVFREGRWLWTFLGDDPYTMHILNFEAVNGVSGYVNNSYSLDPSAESYAAYAKTTVTQSGHDYDYYPVSLPATDKGDAALWGLCNGYGSESTVSLQATSQFDDGDALYWTMLSYTVDGTTTEGIMLSAKNGRSSAIQLVPYTPQQYEDVDIVIRRVDDPGVADRTLYTADHAIYTEAGKQSGITADYASAKDRLYVVGDVIENTADGSTIPELLRRKFCTYTVYQDRYTTPGDFTIRAEGEQKYVYVSYDVTTDMFLKTEPSAAEVERMARENDHVYFMDFRDSNPTSFTLPYTAHDSGFHAYYKEGNVFVRNGHYINDQLAFHPDSCEASLTDPHKSAYARTGKTNAYVYQTTENRMESVPENLKWYFVGDPYGLQVFCTREPGKNLARFHDTETFYQYVLDCVHLRNSDVDTEENGANVTPPAVANIYALTAEEQTAWLAYAKKYGTVRDIRYAIDVLDEDGHVVYRTDADGNYLDAYGNIVGESERIRAKKTNTAYGDLLYPKFYWEVVPCRSVKSDAFALRFHADNTALSYKGVYYYLAHNGITHTYHDQSGDESVSENYTYPIDLSYTLDNTLEQQDLNFTGLHQANNEMTVVRLVQPARVYVSAVNAATGVAVTTDELSEYYGVGENLDNVPRHFRRPFVDYTELKNLQTGSTVAAATSFGYRLTLDDGVPYVSGTTYTTTYNYTDPGVLQSSCTDGSHPTYGKNATYKFSVKYALNCRGEQLFTSTADFTDPSRIRWTDINMGGGNHWLCYDNTGVVAARKSTDNDYPVYWPLNANSGVGLSASDYTQGVEHLKGMHWALVGDPYRFQAVNRRRYEGLLSGASRGASLADCYLGTASQVNTDALTVSYAKFTAGDHTPWEAEATVDPATSGNTEWGFCFFKTGDDSDYYIRTSSLKTSTDDPETHYDDQETNTFGRLTIKSVEDEARLDRPYYVEDFDLAWTLRDQNGNGYGNVSSKVSLQTVADDASLPCGGDNTANDSFDANVYVYKKGAHSPVAYLEAIELPYGDAVEALPWSLRRYGCDYTCYLDYNAATNTGTLTPTFTTSNISDAGSLVNVVYEYTVTEEAQKFFTSEEDAKQEAFTWTNGYYSWQETLTESSEPQPVPTSVYVGPHINEDGKVDGEIYTTVITYQTITSTTTVDAEGWVNSHSGNEDHAFADQNWQTDNNDQKWALIGDPYSFEMKNYQFYLDGYADDLHSALDTDNGHDVGFSLDTSSRWTIAIAADGNTYLALCDADGNVLQYVTFDSGGSSDEHLYKVGSNNTLSVEPTGNTLFTAGAKPFALKGLQNYAAVVIYHLVIGHQTEREAYKGSFTDEQLKNTYGLTAQITAGMNKADYDALSVDERLAAYGIKPWEIDDTYTQSEYEALTEDEKQDYFDTTLSQTVKGSTMGYVYQSYKYYADQPINSIALHEAEVSQYWGDADNSGRTSLRDVITFPIDDYVGYDVGVGNRLSVPWYMRRQFCNYTLYRKDLLEAVQQFDPVTGDPLKDENGQNVFVWQSVLTPAEKAEKVILSTVQQNHKDRMLIVDVVYDVDESHFRFSDKRRSTTAWYSLMTHDEQHDGLMNFSYKDGIGARMDRTTHYTNNYLWAPVGDPYGFTLHNRYATVNGTGWDNVVVTTGGVLPMDVDDAGALTAAGETPTAYQASYTSAGGSMRYVDSRITHLGKGELRSDLTPVETWAAINADYEMLVSNYSGEFLMHPVSARIDPTDKLYDSNFMVFDRNAHHASLHYGSGVNYQNQQDASWRLVTTPEQLWPYFLRSGYVGGLKPSVAMQTANMALRESIRQYVADSSIEPDYHVLDRARELVYSGRFVNAATGVEVNFDDPRPAEGIRFESDNLVPMQTGYYRIKALSENELNLDGRDLAGSKVRGIVGPRYITGYHHKTESTIDSLNGSTGAAVAGARWLHFNATTEDSATVHTYAQLDSIIALVNAYVAENPGSELVHSYGSSRVIYPHPAMRGNIEILPVEYDPASIFHFRGVGDALRRYTFDTQGMRVRARAGGTEGQTTDYGETLMVDPAGISGMTFPVGDANTVDPASGRYNYFDDRFYIDDIGGTAMTLRILDPKVDGTVLDNTTAFEQTVGKNIQTNYLCIDRNHRHRITAHWDNELVEIGDHNNGFGQNGIQDTKWLLQPVGTSTDEYHNEMPLRIEVHRGGEADKTGDDIYYYYGTSYVPFDTRLSTVTDGAFTATYSPSPKSANLAALSTLNNQGNSQFIPAYWPVIIRTSAQKTGQWMTWNATAGALENIPSRARSYVEADVPNTTPSALGSTAAYEAKGGKLHGSLLEQTLDLSDDQNVMVLALPFMEVSDKLTYGAANAQAYYAYDRTDPDRSRVGFYTNENWAREGWNTAFIGTTLGDADYTDDNEADGHQKAYENDARTATYAQRGNHYVYANRVYYLPPLGSGVRTVSILFEGDELPDDPEVYDPEVNLRAGYVYDLGGRIRAKGQTPASLRKNEPRLPSGVYIYRGKKVIVQ